MPRLSVGCKIVCSFYTRSGAEHVRGKIRKLHSDGTYRVVLNDGDDVHAYPAQLKMCGGVFKIAEKVLIVDGGKRGTVASTYGDWSYGVILDGSEHSVRFESTQMERAHA